MLDFLDSYQAKVDKDNLPNNNQDYAAGKNLALMHNIGLDFKTNSSGERNIFSELERTNCKKKVFVDEFEGGKEFIKQAEEAIKFGKEDKNIKGLIRNNYRPSNVIFKNDNEISVVIDFELEL